TRQVLIATHSPLFVSYNTDDIVDLIKVCKPRTETQINQINDEEIARIFAENQELIREALGQEDEAGEKDLLLEGLRHFLWLNPERCSLFFSELVLIVEGLTEQVLITYLIKTNQLQVPPSGIFVLDASGKYEIPRFMNLLHAFKINHAVVHDRDSTQKHEELNNLIQDVRNENTIGVEVLEKNLEDVLGLTLPSDRDRWKKASALLLSVQTGKVDAGKLSKFIQHVEGLIRIKTATTETSAQQPEATEVSQAVLTPTSGPLLHTLTD